MNTIELTNNQAQLLKDIVLEAIGEAMSDDTLAFIGNQQAYIQELEELLQTLDKEVIRAPIRVSNPEFFTNTNDTGKN